MNENGCGICQSTRITRLLEWGSYGIHFCKQCHVLYTAPLPTEQELNEYYQGFMFRKPAKKDIPALLAKRKKELQKLFRLPVDPGDRAGKKLLDYGGGTGLAYRASQALGLDTHYHDIDSEALHFTIDTFGLPPEKTVNNLESSKQEFDYIFSDNVIEHVKDPIGFTALLVDHLAPNGTLIIKTPQARNTATYFNPLISVKGYFMRALKYNSLTRTLYGFVIRFWHCDPPRHLYSFSPESLRHIARVLPDNDTEHELLYYRTPVFSNTVSQLFFTPDKRLNPIQSVVIRLAILPFIPLEVLILLVKWLLLELRLLSPEGIILKIRKKHGQTTSENPG